MGNLAGDSRISVLSQVLKPSTKTFLDFLKVLANPVVLSYKPLPYKKSVFANFQICCVVEISYQKMVGIIVVVA